MLEVKNNQIIRASLRTLCKTEAKTEMCEFFQSYNYFKVLLCTAIKKYMSSFLFKFIWR